MLVRHQPVYLIFITGLLILLLPSACKKEEPVIPEPTTISLQSGGDQSAEVSQILPNSVIVVVKDQEDKSFEGATVYFSIDEGSLSATSMSTNKSGEASVNWTLGSTAGTQILRISSYGIDQKTDISGSPINVSATANPLVATSIELVSGSGQSATIEEAITNPLIVLIKDNHGNPLEGAIVNFSVAEGSVSESSLTTDASGYASINWTLGRTLGAQTLIVNSFAPDGITHLSGSPITVNATALVPSSVTDIDGNTYDVVLIGNQIWMAEDLRVTRYADGSAIPHVTETLDWIDLEDNNSDKGYCFYNNDPDTDYGALYTWAAVTKGESNDNNPGTVQGVCPTKWHVATDSELKELDMYLGMSEAEADELGFRGTDEGNKLKEAGTDHWLDSSPEVTNSSGFTALPSGFVRSQTGGFEYLGVFHIMWSATESNSTMSYRRLLSKNLPTVERVIYFKSTGCTVRCIRD